MTTSIESKADLRAAVESYCSTNPDFLTSKGKAAIVAAQKTLAERGVSATIAELTATRKAMLESSLSQTHEAGRTTKAYRGKNLDHANLKTSVAKGGTKLESSPLFLAATNAKADGSYSGPEEAKAKSQTKGYAGHAGDNKEVRRLESLLQSRVVGHAAGGEGVTYATTERGGLCKVVDGAIDWHVEVAPYDERIVGAPVLGENQVWVATESALVCTQPSTGNILFSAQLAHDGMRNGFVAGPVLAGGNAWMAVHRAGRDEILCVATDSGRSRSMIGIDGAVQSLQGRDGALEVVTDRGVFSLDTTTGQIKRA